MKRCVKCAEVKPLIEFHKRNCSSDGRASRCKTCALAAMREWRANTIDLQRARRRHNYHNQTEERRWRRYRQSHARRYGLTLEQYDMLLYQADGMPCPICGITMVIDRKGSDRACVDHCHASGQVRAVICSSCNTGLGFFKDSPDALRKAATYLETQGLSV